MNHLYHLFQKLRLLLMFLKNLMYRLNQKFLMNLMCPLHLEYQILLEYLGYPVRP
jgi:hypothetical protein